MGKNPLSDWVTFVPNKFKPIHNWFYFKEGFSEEFVNFALKEFNLKPPVLDPFCGVGTTLLACKKKGIKSTGVDVSPLAAFVSAVKTRNYDARTLEEELEKLSRLKPEPIERIPVNPGIRRLFYHNALETIWFYRQAIEQISDEKARNFFLLALIDTTGRAANVVKVGGSLRKQKKPGVPVQRIFFGKIKKMILDVKNTPVSDTEPEVVNEDSRILSLEPESVGSVITSPPYLNKIEYTTVYKLELGLFFGRQETKLRAFVGDAPAGFNKEFEGLPPIAQAYFEDLQKVLRNVFVALKPKGKAVVNVAGGCFPHGPVQSDEFIEKIAKKIGFTVVQNILARKIQCNPHYRTEKTEFTKEVVLVLQKE